MISSLDFMPQIVLTPCGTIWEMHARESSISMETFDANVCNNEGLLRKPNKCKINIDIAKTSDNIYIGVFCLDYQACTLSVSPIFCL